MSRSSLFSVCRSCQRQLLGKPPRRTFSASISHRAAGDGGDDGQDGLSTRTEAVSSEKTTPPRQQSARPTKPSQPSFQNSGLDQLAQDARNTASTRQGSGVSLDEPYHLNIYAHKHNVHITFTEPSRNPIISYSTGNIGLRKAQRGSFDAAYQLAAYTMRKMAEKQWRIGGKGATFNKTLTINDAEVRDRGVEVIMRGYGPGREAFQKALLGAEGRVIKPLVRKVTDATRLKFGGTRSRAVRRLG